VLLDGVTQLVRCDGVVEILDLSLVDGSPSRLVQATLPIDLDRHLAALHIDLNEGLERRVTFEQLWAGAIALWIIGSDRNPV
jgi:ABC-type transport system involved in cytochrome c biogenesis ATPase subunit